MTERWLIDKSALWRLGREGHPLWLDRIDRGLVHICTPTLLEVGFSARNFAEWSALLDEPPVTYMPREFTTPAAENRVLEVQGHLVAAGLHRAPSVADLLIAAIAETSALTVLHVDKDFDLIASITGQPVERLT